jgi:hypothetical protein
MTVLNLTWFRASPPPEEEGNRLVPPFSRKGNYFTPPPSTERLGRGDGDLPEQHNYVFSIMAALIQTQNQF